HPTHLPRNEVPDYGGARNGPVRSPQFRTLLRCVEHEEQTLLDRHSVEELVVHLWIRRCLEQRCRRLATVGDFQPTVVAGDEEELASAGGLPPTHRRGQAADRFVLVGSTHEIEGGLPESLRVRADERQP